MENGMETVKKRNRRSKPKVENYYKVLGLRSNTRPEKIKQSYIQLVKQNPPEQYPEAFERIRIAYETLRDPIKRQQYDLMRKFGGSIENLMDEFHKYMEQENWDQAEKILSDLLIISPDMVGARMGLAQIQLMKDDLDQFEYQIKLLLEGTKAEEEQVSVLVLKAKMLNDTDYSEEALHVLDLIRDKYPDYADEYRYVNIQVYLALDRAEEALELFELEIPTLEVQEPDHIFLFTAWINTMMEVEKWGLSDKIQKRMRKFLKSIKDEDDKLMVISELISEYEAFFEGGYFRAAVFYIDLLFFLDPRHPFVLEKRANVQELFRTEKELHRSIEDQELFPLVSFQAMTWFYNELGQSDVVMEYENMFPFGFMREMELLDEEYAAGIKRIQKKYPLIYRRYKKEWDRLFEEKTAGLNREARRRLK
jgi:tetratricopeptide (TPR) repeat protein